MPGYARDTQRSSQMRFTRSRSANQHDVMGLFSKVQVSQFANQALIDAPHFLMRGFVDKLTLTTPAKGGTGDAVLEIASMGRALTKPLNRYRSNASLTARAPTDTFRKYASVTEKVEVDWGRGKEKAWTVAPIIIPKFGGSNN